MKAVIQSLTYFLVQAAPYAVAIVLGFVLRGCP